MKDAKKINPCSGQTVDNFLKEQEILDECKELAFKEILAEQLQMEMQKKKAHYNFR